MSSRNERRRKPHAQEEEHRKRKRDHSRAYHAAHRAEINERKRRRWATHSEARARALSEIHRANRLRRQYGISLAQYELILARQNGACAICRQKSKRTLCVDHCHETGKVRGLLCTKCNSALGLYQDDPNLTEAATAYLRAAHARLTDRGNFKPRGKSVPSTDEQTEIGKASRLMRGAILRELQRPPGAADRGPTDKLRLVACKLVDKAVEGDIQAIKEVLDRIDGKTVAGPDDAEQGPRQVSIRWKNPTSPSSTSRAGDA